MVPYPLHACYPVILTQCSNRHPVTIQAGHTLGYSKTNFYTLIKIWPHNFEGDKIHLYFRELTENYGFSLPGFPP